MLLPQRRYSKSNPRSSKAVVKTVKRFGRDLVGTTDTLQQNPGGDEAGMYDPDALVQSLKSE